MTSPPSATSETKNNRARHDRRQSILHALWVGSFAHRRLAPRRRSDRSPAAVDWHHPQWLAVAVLILLLCCADALLTLALINNGASEINPLMRPLVTGSGHSFVLWKFGLTSAGVIMLILLARARAFGRWPAGPLLYLTLFGYAALVGYELWLLGSEMGDPLAALFEAANLH